jgi:L-amino acid N-acyltransferase YncA
MNLESIKLIPAEPDRHFAAIAELMNTQETEPNSADTLKEWHGKHLEDGIWFTVAISEDGEVNGFSGIYLASLTRERFYHIYLIVDETWRRHGLGSMLYEDLLSKAVNLGAKTLGARVREPGEEGLRFAERRGFSVMQHSIEMKFDLKSWDARRYVPIIEELQGQGFHFTNMVELGDTPEARRKLFRLNNDAAATDPGSNGIPPWA